METQTLTQWNLDTMHSELQFKVKHLVISTVTGSFKNFNVEVATEGDDFTTAQIKLTADVSTIDTGNEQRDGHLKSDDFFNAEKFPALTFESTGIKKVDEESFILSGNLTIRDITKPVDLNVVLGGIAVDPYGNTKAGFEVEGKVNRKEFDLKWNGVTEAGSVVVGDVVKILGNIQVAKAQ
ncbi:MAG: YceI family protein [Imperialibacter sp.]|uniref:YceI family protein n=1 Tax=Imperialibacter sp. TaxID=2038411 RepID=UPI0030DD72F5|tara:strand:- start:662 stop:1204 length:543 start_codon:yes stop_codon:yes gene_type:complete